MFDRKTKRSHIKEAANGPERPSHTGIQRLREGHGMGHCWSPLLLRDRFPQIGNTPWPGRSQLLHDYATTPPRASAR